MTAHDETPKSDETLRGHLRNHWMAATTGTAVFHRVGRTLTDRQAAAEVRRLAEEVSEDRDDLRDLMRAVGIAPARAATAAARLMEEAGRLRMVGPWRRSADLMDVVQLEGLRTMVWGKRVGWQLLRAVAEEDIRLDRALLDRLIVRAEDQQSRLERLHLRVGEPRLLE